LQLQANRHQQQQIFILGMLLQLFAAPTFCLDQFTNIDRGDNVFESHFAHSEKKGRAMFLRGPSWLLHHDEA
jgi:hypothetical protein